MTQYILYITFSLVVFLLLLLLLLLLAWCAPTIIIDDGSSSMGADDVGVSIRHSLEDIYQLMLMIWCRESLALRRLDRPCGT